MLCACVCRRGRVAASNGDADTNLDNMILDGCGGVEGDDEDLELRYPAQASTASSQLNFELDSRLKFSSSFSVASPLLTRPEASKVHGSRLTFRFSTLPALSKSQGCVCTCYSVLCCRFETGGISVKIWLARAAPVLGRCGTAPLMRRKNLKKC